MPESEKNEKIIEGLSRLSVPSISAPPEISLEYLRMTGKQSALVNAKQDQSAVVQSGKITIRLAEPIWIYDLTIWLQEQDKAEKLANHVTVRLVNSRGAEREVPLNIFERYLDCFPKDFIVELEIKFFDVRKSLISKPPVCERIAITGLNAEDFSEFSSNIGGYLTASKKFSDNRLKLIEQLKKINEDIAESEAVAVDKNEALSEVAVELEQKKAKLKYLEVEISKAEAKASMINNQSANLEQRVQENERLNQHLVDSIQDNREELQALLANKNVFMEEFSSYVEQGKGNIITYFSTGAILLLIVGVCLWRLIVSAVALSNDPEILETVSAFDLFISRVPLAFLLGSVMIICLRIIYVLLAKVFDIHHERLLLAKLSILAKDNSFFSASGLNVPGELIYNKRVSLKMDLLKEFLAGNYRGAVEKEIKLRQSFQEFKDELIRKKDANSELNEDAVDER